uniref:Probable low-specificity L-threonine aldolase 2 n=1 Tax=Gopherus evgoodei TaxID=1825980 RepID=A0A8C4WTH9_9SAUR
MAMRQAMAQAEVGDDDYGEDPTVNELQRLAAQLLGMEEALFVPTSTMANLIAVMCHCQRRGAQLLVGREAHLHVFEQGGVAQGLGAPAGALVAGCREFVAEAWRIRKLLGGGMRQAGVLAAAARIGLEHMEETLQRDHRNARRFAQGIWELGSPICSVDPSAVETNMVLVTVAVPWLSPEKLCERMQAVSEEEVAETGRAVSVRLFPWAAHSLRAVWHCDVSAQDTQLAANKLKFVAEQCWWERGAAP